MSQTYVISVMARDRVGIIADVTGAIRELGGNLADLSQTVLGGYFTMILVASFPGGVTEEGVRERLRQLDPAEPFEVGVKPRLATAAPAAAGGAKYVLTAVGPDKIGLVAVLSGYLREKGINIEDLATRVDGERYWMTLLVYLPAGTDVGKLKRSLKLAMAEAGIQAELQHESIFRATNEV
ncbi:MAG: ACT domain-containing protein [Lentisphaeria bacterium]